MQDEITETIVNYVDSYHVVSEEAYRTAVACLADSLGCALLALNFHECIKLLGPVVPGTVVPNGSRVPGTKYVLDPIRAAFNIGSMIRWLDFNDTWLAAEWGHPSDNLGGLLAVADYIGRITSLSQMTVKDLLTFMIKAHEIQGGLAILNSFNRVGFDHVIFVKAATAAVATKMLGGNIQQIGDALSQVWVDAGPLRTYRHAPNTGSRKSWAAGDATSRGVQFALMTIQGEQGYRSALSASRWGLYDVLFQGKPFALQRPLGSYVMENVLFKVSFPAEFHAQTAVEAAIKLHPQIQGRLGMIESIVIGTHESAIRIIDKTGPLHNPADRDHCLQYMVAIGLLYGNLTAEHYEDKTAEDSRINELRSKMKVKETIAYSKDYLDPDKRSIANSLTIHLKGGQQLGPVVVEYPLGHRKRREEGLPLIYQKFESNLRTRLSEERVQKIMALFANRSALELLHPWQLMDYFLE